MLTCTAFVPRGDLLVSPKVLLHVVKIAQTEGEPHFKRPRPMRVLP